jgi:MoaA/NifB/PqqE/SkfB family radical SAM enzyme
MMKILPVVSPFVAKTEVKPARRISAMQLVADVKNILQARLAMRFKNLYMPSLFGYYHVNSVCNLRCSYCYINQPEIFPEGFSQVGLPLERAKKVLATMRQECVALRILGGEPMLYKGLVEILQYAKRDLKYWHLSLITNGLYLFKDPQQLDVILDHLNLITISIDQTRVDEYPKQMAQLFDFFPELRQRCREHKVALTCNYTATWDELAHPERIENVIKGYQPYFTSFYITPVRNVGKTPLPLLKNSLQLNRKYTLGHYLGPEYPETENTLWYQENCDPKLKIKIDPDGGLIYPCENHIVNIGSLETYTIKELWNKQPVKYPNESCLGCGKQRFRSYAFKNFRRQVLIWKGLREAAS